MLKSYTRMFFLLLLIVTVFFLLSKLFNWPSPSEWFSSQPIRLEDSPLMVQEIKALSELTTISYFDEVVVDSVRKKTVSITPFPGMSTITLGSLPIGTDRLVIIGKGRVNAGIDLQRLREEDIKVTGDSISVNLPPAIILDVIINPSGFETYVEEGTWSQDAILALKNKARQQLEQNALKNDILQKASVRGKIVIDEFLDKLYKK